MVIPWEVFFAILNQRCHSFFVCLLFRKEKVGIFAAPHINSFPFIYPMGVHDNTASLGLTEDPGKTHHRDPLRIDHITEHISGAYTWKLINVTN